MAFPNFGDEILSISGSLDKDNVAADPPRRLAIRGSARARARVLLLLRAGGARGGARGRRARGAICSVSSALFGACIARARLGERNLSGRFRTRFDPGTRNSPYVLGVCMRARWARWVRVSVVKIARSARGCKWLPGTSPGDPG